MTQLQQSYRCFNEYKFYLSSQLKELIKGQLTANSNLKAIETKDGEDDTVNEHQVLIEVLKMISSVFNLELESGDLPQNTIIILRRLIGIKDDK